MKLQRPNPMATRLFVCESAEHPSSLLYGLNEQRLKGVLCDVTVQVQGHHFKAHVSVLASAMGYFRDLFSKSVKDKHSGIVEIPVIVNSTGFAKILDFIYTSQLCLSQSTVMQVLCSACFLQIPYVVEKCQEFINTHGHVTSPSSLSEVTTPLLDLQRKNCSKLPSYAQTQNASASLAFLSQLQRLSENSHNLINAETKQQDSPKRTRELEEQPECELINTPPTPGGRSSSNGDDSGNIPDLSEGKLSSTENLKTDDVLTLKREPDPETSSNEERQALTSYFPRAKFQSNSKGADYLMSINATKVSNEFGEQHGIATADYNERDAIDHKLLADYFSSDREKEFVADDLRKCRFPPASRRDDRGKFVLSSSTERIYSMSEDLKRDRSIEKNSNQSSILPKKEKPKKEYKCDYCSKLFGRQQHLKRHILTHTGERPYPCQYCDKRFRRSEHLKHHLANHVQAMGIDAQPKLKRPRKSQPPNDAYSFSKMMLTNYNNHISDYERGKIAESGDLVSAPVVLPSMFTTAENIDLSPANAQLTEMESNNPDNEVESDIPLALDGGRRGSESKSRQASPSSIDQPPITGSNFNFITLKEETETSLEYNDGNTDEPKSCVSGHNSPEPASVSPTLEPAFVSSTLNEAQFNADIIDIEGSEVLTPDLKRLIAAMDE